MRFASLLCLLFALGCPRRGPVGAQGGTGPPPVPPTSTRSPYDATLPVPPLTGAGEHFDIERLAHTSTSYDVAVDASALSRVDPDNWNAVFQQLAAHPTWRVTEYDNAMVALQRRFYAASWTVPRNGFHEQHGTAWRTLLRFTAWDQDLPWSNAPTIARVPVDTQVFTVTPFVLGEPWQGRFATAVALEAHDLALEVYEAGPGDGREHTVRALAEIPVLVSDIVLRSSQIEQNGYDRMLMPKGEPHHGQPWLKVISPGPGQLDVQARVNPGEAGWTWVRLVQRGGPWEEDAVAIGTREAVGWSADPTLHFYLQGQFPVPPGEAFHARAEVWMQPAEGDRPVKLVDTFDVLVPPR